VAEALWASTIEECPKQIGKIWLCSIGRTCSGKAVVVNNDGHLEVLGRDYMRKAGIIDKVRMQKKATDI
jgi:hypothetical protein